MERSSVHEQGHSDDDSFEDAQELHAANAPAIPITRVEKTDDNPAHGEVPGTEAYEMRQSDAVPDELEVVPEGSRSRSSSVDQRASRSPSSSREPPVPKTVVEKVDPNAPSHGEVPGTEAHALRQADATPDEVHKAPASSRAPNNGTPITMRRRSRSEDDEASIAGSQNSDHDTTQMTGDDFDDFAESNEEDDFGDFDEGIQPAEANAQPQPVTTTETSVSPQHLLDFRDLKSADDINDACQPFIDQIFPSSTSPIAADVALVSNSFLNERSHSLWSQLVAPAALQPPNWVRSRTRRLFLVSLGVPVDLDEILPASKQKKLVLPSIDVEQERYASQRDGMPANGTVSKLKQQNTSSTSVHRSLSKSERKRKGPPPPPEFNENDARLMCSTSVQALTGFSDKELESHRHRLENLKKRASDALEYWLIQRDSAHSDKEAFEEVIQNLVKHAQKIRT